MLGGQHLVKVTMMCVSMVHVLTRARNRFLVSLEARVALSHSGGGSLKLSSASANGRRREASVEQEPISDQTGALEADEGDEK